jgi:beta-lactamase regulating signal transducer with metallopeptidase domain
MTSIALTTLMAGGPVVSVLTKVTLALMLGLAASRLVRRATTSHLMLVATFAAVVLIPAIDMAAPPLVVQIVSDAVAAVPLADTDPAGRAVAGGGGEAFVLPTPTSVDPRGLLAIGMRVVASFASRAVVALWLIGAAAVAGALMIDVLRIRALRRAAIPNAELAERVRQIGRRVGVRDVDVLMSDRVQAPLVTGMRAPVILVPTDAAVWSDEELLRALVHEVEHVRRADWAKQLAARSICAFYWFHPLVWVAWNRMCLAAERACDDAVTEVADPTAYAEQLVALARRRHGGGVGATVGMAGRSKLSARVRALLDPEARRGRAGPATTAAVVIVAAVAVAFVAPLHAERAPNEVGAPFRSANDLTRLDRQLYEAAARGESEAVERLIAHGAHVNTAIPGDGSALIGAVRSGRIELVRLLLDRGAKPDLEVPGDGNALIVAARRGHLGIVRTLLAAGAPMDDIVPGDETALIGASYEGQLDVVRLLVERGADVNLRAWAERGPGRPDGEWRTPLNMAERRQQRQVVEYLRSVGARQ